MNCKIWPFIFMTTGNGFKNKSKRCSSFCFQNFVVEVAVEIEKKRKKA